MNPRKRLMLKKKARQKAAQAEVSLPTEVDLITEEEIVEAKPKPAYAPRVVAKEVDNTISKKRTQKTIKTTKTTKTTSKGE